MLCTLFLQIGKYWSKDERKKHLEKAKERRQKQLDMIQNKNEAMRKSPSASANISGYRKISNKQSDLVHSGRMLTPPSSDLVNSGRMLTPPLDKSPMAMTPPPNTSASSNNGSTNPLLTSSEPVLLSVTTV